MELETTGYTVTFESTVKIVLLRLLNPNMGSSIYDVHTKTDYLDPPPPVRMRPNGLYPHPPTPPPMIVDVHIDVEISPFYFN